MRVKVFLWFLFIDFVTLYITLFENQPKCRIWIYNFGIPAIYVLLKFTFLVTMEPHASVFQKLAKLAIFWHF